MSFGCPGPPGDGEEHRRVGPNIVLDEEMRGVDPATDPGAVALEEAIGEREDVLVRPHVGPMGNMAAEIERVDAEQPLATGAPLREVGLQDLVALETEAG